MTRKQLPPTRSVRDALKEILALSFLLSLLAAIVLGFLHAGDWVAVGEALPRLGAKALEHIGWALGAIIAILLAFYFTVIGGQLIKLPRIPEATRTLALLGELMAASMVPALALIVIYSASAPDEVGALIVIMPIAFVTFVIAAQLGVFLALTKRARLRAAELRKRAMDEAASNITRTSLLPAWVVMVATIAIIPALAGGLAGLVERSVPAAVVVFVTSAFVVLVTSLAGLELQHTSNTPNDRVTVWGGRFMFGVAVAIGILVVLMAISFQATAAVLTAISLLLIAVSVLLPQRLQPQFLLNCTVQGAALRRSRSYLQRNSEKEAKTIAELRKDLRPRLPSFRGRLDDALAALQSDVAS